MADTTTTTTVENPPETKGKLLSSPITILAAFGLMIITLVAVGSLAYDMVVNGNPASVAQLATIATLGVGGLLALSGNPATKTTNKVETPSN